MELRKRSVLDHLILDVNIIVLLTMMTSMGVIFPPVAIASAVSIYIFTLFTQMKLVYVLSRVREADEELARTYEKVLNDNCNHFVRSAGRSIQMLPPISAAFCAFIVFDTLGDTDRGGVSAMTISLSVLVLIIPGVMWVLNKAYTASRPSKVYQQVGDAEEGVPLSQRVAASQPTS
jgi:hypothetical protein